MSLSTVNAFKHMESAGSVVLNDEQLHALQKFYESGGVSYDDFEGLQSSLITNKGKIYIFMKEQSYPRISVKGLMDVIDYMEKGE